MYSLVLGADGPDSTGLQVLLESLHKLWPKGRHIVLVPGTPVPWVGTMSHLSNTFGGSLSLKKSKTLEKVGYKKDVYEIKGTPVDAVYYAANHSSELLGFDRMFDIVYAGVHHGSVLGMEVLHAADVVAAAVATRIYGLPSLSFAQQMVKPESGDVDPKQFELARKLVPQFLKALSPIPGESLLVNIPNQPPIAPGNAIIADYHPKFPAKSAPFRRSKRKTDITVLEQGYVSVAEMVLNVNIPFKIS